MIQTAMSIWVSFVMLFVSFVPGFTTPTVNAENSKSYPYVFVHGFLGWGENEGIDADLSYWGATSCKLITNLREKNYECFDASVGPLSSNWDRACELYAQIVGKTVDYGVAHSAKCNHSRYGRTYDKPIIENWGELDEEGLINKINLIGHSFGGNTIRLLVELLSNGNQDEIAATSSDNISDLFTGGKSNWVNSVVTICTPNNGTTLAYISDELSLTELLTVCAYTYAGIFGRSIINGYFDFHLEQFGLTDIPGDDKTGVKFEDAMKVIIKNKYDSFAYDLSPDGAEYLNSIVGMEDNIYYFSYAFTTTTQGKYTNNYFPMPSTLVVLTPFATMMGGYKENTVTDYKIDETWLENDGLVNLVSAKYPFDDPHTDYSADKIETGIWNVMPVSVGDHGTAIGIGTSEEETMNYYNGIIGMIESLPITK